MRILVVNPPNEPFSEESLLIEPIDILTIATFVNSLNHNVKVIDMDVEKQSANEIEKTIKEFKPNITIILFEYHIPLHTSLAISNVNEIGKIAKQYQSKVVVAGKSPKHYPYLFLNNGADVLINGEAELVLYDLLKLNKWTTSNLARIKGISFKHQNIINTTEKRIDKVNLDSLPIPNRDLIDLSKYIDVRTMLTSRGCYGKCNFCPTKSFWGSWRGKSPIDVVDEIEYLIKKYNSKKILFLDDNATVSSKRMEDISKEIINRTLNVKLGCLGTIEKYNKESMQLMYEAGFRWIHYGIESGNNDILKSIGKNITSEQIKKVIRETKEIGFRVRTSFIFDLPNTTKKSLQDTIDLILEIEPDEIRAHYLALRAGTEIYDKMFQGSNKIPSQYIHSNFPMVNLSDCNQSIIIEMIDKLISKLQEKNYLIIKNVNEWRNIENNDSNKFISLCPAKYGMGW
jgi:anaerobic magnesium-protoporphyrin IX monomethyl ester cyclase